jgi:hypothetical protein
MWEQQVARAMDTRDGARRIAVEAMRIMTDEQLLQLRDLLVCYRLEEEL